MNENIKRLCLSSMFAALTFAVTRFIQIPIPLGYLNFGNCIILLGCCFLPCRYAAAAGALGSALADLTSFPIYTVPTLIIKAVMPLAFFALLKAPVKNNYLKHIIAAAVSTLVPLAGYTAAGAVFYGGFAAGLAQVPGLVAEYFANLALFALMLIQVIRRKIRIEQ